MADRSRLTPGRLWAKPSWMPSTRVASRREPAPAKLISAYMTGGDGHDGERVAALLQLFAERPEVWDTLKSEPSLAHARCSRNPRLEVRPCRDSGA